MAVLRLAADERLVNLDDTHQLAEVLVRHPGPDAVAHVPGRPVGAEAHHAVYLKGANPLLAGQHQVDDAEPLAQRLIRVLEDRVDQDREPIAVVARSARVAYPVEARACGLTSALPQRGQTTNSGQRCSARYSLHASSVGKAASHSAIVICGTGLVGCLARAISTLRFDLG